MNPYESFIGITAYKLNTTTYTLFCKLITVVSQVVSTYDISPNKLSFMAVLQIIGCLKDSQEISRNVSLLENKPQVHPKSTGTEMNRYLRLSIGTGW